MSIAVLILVVVAAVVGGAIVIGAPVFAVPVVALLLAGWGVYELGRRGLRRGPRGDDEPIRFTEEDRKTLVPSPSQSERRRNRRDAARSIGS